MEESRVRERREDRAEGREWREEVEGRRCGRESGGKRAEGRERGKLLQAPEKPTEHYQKKTDSAKKAESVLLLIRDTNLIPHDGDDVRCARDGDGADARHIPRASG